MTSIEREGPDPPACPLLGLATDRRSHFTYPQPGHRCFATTRPAATDAHRQATYCLNFEFTACDRYRAWEQASRATHPSAAQPKVVHVYRAGDSLARIATAYGLTVEQVATANGLAVDAVIADGARLVIPHRLTPADRSV